MKNFSGTSFTFTVYSRMARAQRRCQFEAAHNALNKQGIEL